MESKLKLANYASQFPFILFYQGNYLEAPTISIIAIVEQHFKLTVKKSNLKTAIYTLIEALQNIERYSAHVISSEDFALIYCDNHYLNIYTQNMIKNDKINDIMVSIDINKTIEQTILRFSNQQNIIDRIHNFLPRLMLANIQYYYEKGNILEANRHWDNYLKNYPQVEQSVINDFNELKSFSFSVRSLYELDHNF